MLAERSEGHQPASRSAWTARLLLLAAAALTLGGIMLPADAMTQVRSDNRHLSQILSWLEHGLPHFGLVHALLFAAVTLCLRWVMPRRPLWQLLLIMLAFAIGSELLQFFAPGRHPRVTDIGDDMAGVGLGLLLAAGSKWLRQPALAAANLAASGWLAVAALVLLPWQRWHWLEGAGPAWSAAGIALLFSLAFRGVAALGGLPARLGRFHAWLALVLLLASSSVVFSPKPGSGLVAWFELVYFALAASLLCDLGGEIRWRRRLVLAWIAGAIAAAALALAAAAIYWARPDATSAYVPLMASPYTVAWGWLPRVRSTFANVHEFGSHLCIALALVMACLRLGWLKPISAALAATGLLAAGALAWSPAFGALALVAGVYFWIGTRQQRPGVARVALLAGVGIAGALLMVAVLDPTDPWGSASIRVQVWRAALESIALQPWSGTGLGQPVVNVLATGPHGMRMFGDAHNVWLSVAAQAGLPTMLGLVALVVHVMRRGCSQAGTTGAMAPLHRALWLGFAAAWLYHGVSTSVEGYLHLWLCMGLLAAMVVPGKRGN